MLIRDGVALTFAPNFQSFFWRMSVLRRIISD